MEERQPSQTRGKIQLVSGSAEKHGHAIKHRAKYHACLLRADDGLCRMYGN